MSRTHVILGLLLLAVTWALAGVISRLWAGEWLIAGQIGDSFGSVNALFSGLALAGVVATLYLQRQELALQRQELRQTREELQRTAVAQEKAHLALERQVDSMKLTARLNALNLLLEATNQDRESAQSVLTQTRLDKRRRELIEQAEVLALHAEEK